MRNNEDIIKKILLHMKYDSNKTLKGCYKNWDPF